MDISNKLAAKQDYYINKIKVYFDICLHGNFNLKNKAKLKTSIGIYIWLLDLYKQKNWFEFDVLFFYYYGLSGHFSFEKLDSFFCLLNKKSLQCEEFYNEAFLSLQIVSKKKQKSFSSKLTHIVFNDFPIIDRYVCTFFRVQMNQIQYKDLITIKNVYTNAIREYSQSLKDFKKTYGCPNISDIKVLDFLIWINQGK